MELRWWLFWSIIQTGFISSKLIWPLKRDEPWIYWIALVAWVGIMFLAAFKLLKKRKEAHNGNL